MQGSLKPEPLRTRIYIDGYNFYHGCLRGTPHKWLDLLPLFEKHILPSASLKDHDAHLIRRVEKTVFSTALQPSAGKPARHKAVLGFKIYSLTGITSSGGF